MNTLITRALPVVMLSIAACLSACASVENASSQPAAKTESQPTTQAESKRMTRDGVELPLAASHRWYGAKFTLPSWQDPIGKTPEDLFGNPPAVYTLQQSAFVARRAISPNDFTPPTLPYFALNQWGADYIGFSLFEGRIYRLEVRYKNINKAQYDAIVAAFYATRPAGKPESVTGKYAVTPAAFPKNAATTNCTLRFDPTWQYLFPENWTFAPGMSIKECMDGSQCSRKRPARDAQGEHYILSKPQTPQSADRDDTVYIDVYKVYMSGEKAVSMVEIK